MQFLHIGKNLLMMDALYPAIPRIERSFFQIDFSSTTEHHNIPNVWDSVGEDKSVDGDGRGLAQRHVLGRFEFAFIFLLDSKLFIK